MPSRILPAAPTVMQGGETGRGGKASLSPEEERTMAAQGFRLAEYPIEDGQVLVMQFYHVEAFFVLHDGCVDICGDALHPAKGRIIGLEARDVLGDDSFLQELRAPKGLNYLFHR